MFGMEGSITLQRLCGHLGGDKMAVRKYTIFLRDAQYYRDTCTGLKICKKQMALHKPFRYPCTLNYWWADGNLEWDEEDEEWYPVGFCQKVEITYGD